MRRMLDEKDVKDISLETIEQKNLKPVSGTVENNKWKTITIGSETHGFAGGSGGNAEWGDITGDIADQTDLKNALDAKANSADLTTVATTGDYDDLLNKPDLSVYAEISTLGTAAYIDEDNLSIGYSQLTNAPDLSIYAESADLATVATSGSYADLLNKPTLGTASACNTGTSSGNVPVLDSNGKLANSVIPSIAITDTFVAQDQAEMLALTADVGDVCVRTDQNKSYILRETPASVIINWQELLTPTDAVQSVNGQTGNVVLSIPAAVSGTNDGTNWLTLTIGSDTYGIGGGSTPSNMVTTDTAQDITGLKTFVNNNGIYIKSADSNTGRIHFKDQYANNIGSINVNSNNTSTTGSAQNYVQIEADNGYGIQISHLHGYTGKVYLHAKNSITGLNLGSPSNQIDNIYLKGTSLSGGITDGTDTVNTFEQWTFVLSDNTTVTKTVIVG